MNVINYIKQHWDDTVRLERKGNDNLIGLPYEYFVPSISGMFQEIYYWDTFFTAKGLLLCGREALVKSTVENMFYLIDKFGFMPNGNIQSLLGRSQPPFLSAMVRDLYDVYQDKVWLSMAYGILKKEYDFWMTKRITPTGLNRYGYDLEAGQIPENAQLVRERLHALDLSSFSDEEIVENYMADAESGWDFNPRCGGRQTECVFVDLNSILYDFECNMAFFARELSTTSEEHLWQKSADSRRTKMHQLLFDGEVFRDYNFKTDSHSPVFSCASFYPLWAKAATKEQAASVVRNLHRLEEAHGLAVCENGDRSVKYQWDYPNGWAPLHYIVVHALDNYGYKEDAARIAAKYVRSMEKIFEETGALWEKYNVTEASINVNNEYEMPEMLGWTAGVYLDLKDYLGELNK